MAAELELLTGPDGPDSSNNSDDPLEASTSGGVVVVRKVAVDEAERRRFANEALMLQRASHPGVVEFLSFDEETGTLRTQFVGDQTWQSAPPKTVSDLAKGIASIASTLHDLHTLAITHGNLTTDHIILGAGGRPILCDLSAAGDQDPSIDIAALGEVIIECLGRTDEGRSTSGKALASLAARATHDDPSKRPSASAVATAAQQRVSPDSQNADDGHRPSRSVIAATAALVGALALLFWPSGDQPLAIATLDDAIARTTAPRPPTSVEPATAPSQSTAPATTTKPPTAEPLVIEFEGFRYAVGRAGDSAAIGDWDCDGSATAAVLRPHSGQVHLFDGWPDESESSAVTPLTIPNSTAELDATATCGHLVLIDASGDQITLNVEHISTEARS